MKKLLPLFVPIGFAAALILTSCTSETTPPASAGLTLEKLVIALKPDKDPDKMLAEKNQLAAYLSEKLGRPVEVIVPLSSSVIQEGFANGSVDLGYLSATDMLNARNAAVARVLLAGEINGQLTYQSYWVGPIDSPHQSIADLRGRPVAFSSRTSTSGYIVPHADLIQRGLIPEGANPEEFFGIGNVWYGTGYVSAVQQVLNGDAEAAAVSYYVLDQDRHLSAEDRAKLRKIAEQGPVPTHVIAIRTSISAADAALIQETLLAMNDEIPDLRDKVFTSKIVPVDEESHLAPLAEYLRLIGLQR